ncbi:MAG: hypothetical protein LBH61_04270 [Dysgonamonadaceae bacterium]|jgi:hypothetical protein|nr:hypothetical protein [Dysgonamonadaceae bacterium]
MTAQKIHFEVIPGLDERVYQYIAPFAMTLSCIKRNGNPITTSGKHSWYIGFGADGGVACFCSVKIQPSAKQMQVGNLFILTGEEKTFDRLVKRLIRDLAGKDVSLLAYANNETKEWFASHGFETVRAGVNWHNMKYNDSLRSGAQKS